MATMSREVEYPERLTVTGVSFRTLPVEDRERFTDLAPEPGRFLADLKREVGLSEVALISTCNRFEVVSIGESDTSPVVEYLTKRLTDALPKESIYALENSLAARHFLRVTASLDSMVLGEPQILGQVKDSYRSAVSAGSVGKYLHHLFQVALHVAKKVRTNTRVGQNGVSVSYVAVRLAQQIFEDLTKRRALVIGSGVMAELAALHLKSYGCQHITVANRTVSRAAELANRIGGAAIGLGDIPAALTDVDIVIGSINCDQPVLTAEVLRLRAGVSPLFLIDLGVPRVFSEGLSELESVYLYNIDDLATIAQENQTLREEAAKDAELIVDYGLHRFEDWLERVKREPYILELRDLVHEVCTQEVEALLGGHSAELQAKTGQLGHRIGQELAHRLGQVFEAPPEDLPESVLLLRLEDDASNKD